MHTGYMLSAASDPDWARRWFGPVPDFRHWLVNDGLEIVLLVVGAVLASRATAVIAARITDRMDARFRDLDDLVRSEESKHRHALAQVLRYVVMAVIWVIVSVMVVERLGLHLTALVAPATVMGAALGFGAQRIVQDILAGFFLITEKQYGFGDVVEITVASGLSPASGTVEDVTLRVTRIRTVDGEVVTVPNGQIVKVVNLSRDWARAVVDVPVPVTVDVLRITRILRDVGDELYEDEDVRPLLLDPPSVMGVESLKMDEAELRMVVRTLPGKQFDVRRELRARIAAALLREGVMLSDRTRFDDEPADEATDGPADEATAERTGKRAGKAER